jgi:hypothetical protein
MSTNCLLCNVSLLFGANHHPRLCSFCFDIYEFDNQYRIGTNIVMRNHVGHNDYGDYGTRIIISVQEHVFATMKEIVHKKDKYVTAIPSTVRDINKKRKREIYFNIFETRFDLPPELIYAIAEYI